MNHIKYLTLVTICFFAVNAFADDFPSIKCNTKDKVEVDGIPDTSCWVTSASFSVSMDVNEGDVSVFSLQVYDVQLKVDGKEKYVRLTIGSDQPRFNEIQALMQTAYATRSVIAAIFPNPNIENTSCFINGDLVYCPIQALMLSH